MSVKRIVRIAAALAALAMAGPGAGVAQARPAPDSFADLAEQLSPMVVNVSTTQRLKRPSLDSRAPVVPEGSPLEDFFRDYLERGPGTPQRVTSLGSGFVIDPGGLIVTNNHVIEEADEISVTFNDGTSLPAKLVGRDAKTDLALLKVEPRGPLPAARFGDSGRARVGEWVMAIGNPFGLGGSVTVGIISARNRDISAGPYDDFIQTDAPINRGNSGGPLFNMDGEVIGVNSAIYSPTGGSVGISFAIPSSLARDVIAQLRLYGETRRGWLGVSIQEVTENIAAGMGLGAASGALVTELTAGGPADRAGIATGDVIVRFDGKTVPDSRSLSRMVAETEVGKRVTVEALRRGQPRAFEVTLGRLEDAEAAQASIVPAREPIVVPDTHRDFSQLGLSLAPLTPDLRARYRLLDTVQGVVVTGIDPDGPASETNLRPGDVIDEVAQEPVSTPEDVMRLVEQDMRAGKRAVLLRRNRAGDLAYVAVSLGGT